LKLQNGELNQHNYQDVMLAVDDILHPVNNNLTGNLSDLQTNWTNDMKEAHSDLIRDFRNGKLKWSDISLPKVQDVGREIIERVKSGAE